MSVADAVAVGRGILPSLPEEMDARGLDGTVFIVTDSLVGPRFLKVVRDLLEAAGSRVHAIAVEPGEASKSLERAAELYGWLFDLKAERGDLILALGGGVIGDLAGFVAATYLRGMRWVQVATTLLAQVDSSIGGKVGVDLPHGKNMVGAFHSASLSFLDTALLESLPPKQLAAGWAEVIKTAAVFDLELFETFEAKLDDPRDPELLLLAVEACVRHKGRVVDEDPYDRGARMLVNYGHTIGHAIEAATRYSAYLHGEAVAIGMAGAALLSKELGILNPEGVRRQNDLLARLGLPLNFSGATPEAVEAAMRADKKTRDGRPRWVLLEGLGRGVFGNQAPKELEARVIRSLHVA